jgi:hypothetical protein
VREKPELTHPPEKDFDRDHPDYVADLPNPDLNPMVNQTLGRNLGRWAQVYFTNAPENRDRAVGDLLRELENEGGAAQRKGPKSERVVRRVEQPGSVADLAPGQGQSVETEPQAAAIQQVISCPHCRYENPPAQVFCGMCGMTLSERESNNPIRTQQIPPDNMDWLREQPLASFRGSEKDTGESPNSGGRLVAIVVAILIAAFSGYTWWSRSQAEFHSSAIQSVSTPARPQKQEIPQTEQTAPAAERPARGEAERPQGDEKPAAEAPKAPEVRTVINGGSKTSTTTSSTLSSTNGDAELGMAQNYLYGVNGPKDPNEAAKWLWKAVSKQNRTALLLLADLYQRGDGVTKSCDQAQLLLVAAAKKGSPEAGEQLRYLQSAGCK